MSTIKNQPVPFSHAQYKISALDDYSVHLCLGVKATLSKNGYFFVMGGGITNAFQVNDTEYQTTEEWMQKFGTRTYDKVT